jgi:hypothetical protein
MWVEVYPTVECSSPPTLASSSRPTYPKATFSDMRDTRHRKRPVRAVVPLTATAISVMLTACSTPAGGAKAARPVPEVRSADELRALEIVENR